jgi:hypothetical protein
MKRALKGSAWMRVIEPFGPSEETWHQPLDTPNRT